MKTAKEFLESEKINEIIKLCNGKKTGEFIITPEVMQKYATKAIEQVEKEVTGMFELTCGVSKFDYELGANEALRRLYELINPEQG